MEITYRPARDVYEVSMSGFGLLGFVYLEDGSWTSDLDGDIDHGFDTKEDAALWIATA